MRSANWLRILIDWSLCALLIPAAFVALDFFAVGVFFGMALWRPDRPFGIAMWFATVLFPVFVAYALWRSLRVKSLKTTAILASACWAFACFFMWENFVWMPFAHGGPWGW